MDFPGLFFCNSSLFFPTPSRLSTCMSFPDSGIPRSPPLPQKQLTACQRFVLSQGPDSISHSPASTRGYGATSAQWSVRRSDQCLFCGRVAEGALCLPTLCSLRSSTGNHLLELKRAWTPGSPLWEELLRTHWAWHEKERDCIMLNHWDLETVLLS